MAVAPLPKWYQQAGICFSLVLLISVVLGSPPVQAQSSAPDTTRAQFLRQMLHFLKWNAATMREAPPTYCFMTHANNTPEEDKDGVLTIMRQRHPGAEESDHRLLSFNTVSQLELHLANDVCHILYTPYALVDDIGDARLAQYSRTTLTISDDIGFLRRGGIASLNYESERVRLYVNPNQLRQSDIDFASRLMQVTRFYPDLQ